jgi:hypothetical protein
MAKQEQEIAQVVGIGVSGLFDGAKVYCRASEPEDYMEPNNRNIKDSELPPPDITYDDNVWSADDEKIANMYAWANSHIAINKDTGEPCPNMDIPVEKIRMVPIANEVETAVLYGLRYRERENNVNWEKAAIEARQSLRAVEQQVIDLRLIINTLMKFAEAHGGITEEIAEYLRKTA